MQEDAQTQATVEVINEFNEAFNRHDVQAVMALMTEDCVFDNTYPAPDGERFEGQEAVGRFWEEFFRSSPDANFQSEEMIHMETAASFAGGTIGQVPTVVTGTYVA